MSTKNAIVMATSTSCECDTWMKIMSKLKAEVGIHPRYFLYYNEVKLKKGKGDFLSQVGDYVYFHSEYDNYKGKGYYCAKEKNVLDQKLLKFISTYELIALKMMDRFDPLLNAFSFTHRQWYFRELVLVWMDIIDELEIKLFISPDTPHRVSDYALYVACLAKRVKFIYFEMTPFGDASLINDSLDEYKIQNLFDDDMSEREILIKNKLSEYRGSAYDYELDYMKAQQEKANKKTYEKAFGLVFRIMQSRSLTRPIKSIGKLFFGEVFSFYVKRGEMPYTSRFSFLEKIFIDRKVSKFSRGYKDYYNKLVKCVDLEKSRYVIFALHYQPEATTSPNGGVYVDQLLVIDMLDRLLPPDLKILVKEHPSQFYGVLESASVGRSKVFYDRLSRFSDRVIPVSLDLDSFDLIDNSEAVVTITGTIGIESIARGKPVLCFGRTWYEDCEGVFRIKDAEDLLFAWSKISGNDFWVSQKNVDDFMRLVARDFVLGKHSGVYRNRSKRSQDETVFNVVEAIVLFLKKKGFV